MNAESIRETEPLEVRIHRGAHEIGGNCVELRHGRDTLILDIGKPLSATWDTVVPLPDAIGLDDNGTRPWASSSATAIRTTGTRAAIAHRRTSVHR